MRSENDRDDKYDGQRALTDTWPLIRSSNTLTLRSLGTGDRAPHSVVLTQRQPSRDADGAGAGRYIGRYTALAYRLRIFYITGCL